MDSKEKYCVNSEITHKNIRFRQKTTFLLRNMQLSNSVPGDLLRGLRSRRSHLDIHYSILKASCCEGLSLSRIIVYVNLNRRLAKRCIEELVEGGLISTVEEADSLSYMTTEKGSNWLKTYKSLIRT